MAGAGAAIGAVVSAMGQSHTNAQNRKQAQLNRDFQARMSGTAVRRRAFDMEKAGINRILAGKYDASSPAGNMMTHQNVGAAAAEGASKGAGVGMTAAQVGLIRAQTKKIEGEAVIGEQKGKFYEWLAEKFGQLKDAGIAAHEKSTGQTAVNTATKVAKPDTGNLPKRGWAGPSRTHNEAAINATVAYQEKNPKATESQLRSVYKKAYAASLNKARGN